MNRGRQFKFLFWSSVALYTFAMGLFFLPSVHYYYDAVGIRDMSTAWHSLNWKFTLEEVKVWDFLPIAALSHVEGPLQFILMNFYSYTIGHFFPLNPMTYSFLNVLIIVAASFIAFQLGRVIEGEKFGYFFAICFVLSTWVGAAVRLPWIVFTISTLLELAVFYAYYLWIIHPERRSLSIISPLLLSCYLLTSLDWPSFLFCFVLFLFLTNKLKFVIANRYNFIVLGVFLVILVWTVALFIYETGGWKQTLLTYPFFKAGTGMQNGVSLNMLKFIFLKMGPAFIFSIFGSFFVLCRENNKMIKDKLSLTMVIWFIVFSFVLIFSSKSIHYIYVVAVPLAYLGAKFFIRINKVWLTFMIIMLVGVQLYVTTRSNFTLTDDRRVLAVATYLIEERPDLLQEGKIAFLPRNFASNVGQYVRGRQTRIIMPLSFPYKMKSTAHSSSEEVLYDFVQSYRLDKEIKADWLILDSNIIDPEYNKHYTFYRELREDPNIRWTAKFIDKHGRIAWLGEVNPGVESEEKSYDVDPLADRYEAKYDRIDFLKHNVKYIDHY